MMTQLHTSVTAKGRPGGWGRGVSAQALPAFRVCRWSKVEGVLTPCAQLWSSDTYASCRERKRVEATVPENGNGTTAIWVEQCSRGGHCLQICPVATQEGSLTSVHKNTGSSF